MGTFFVLAALFSPSVALALPMGYACYRNGCDTTFGPTGDGGYWMYSDCGLGVAYLQGPNFALLSTEGCTQI